MSISPFDSVLYGTLFGDDPTATAFSDDAMIAAMVRVEQALASVQADLGIIPPAAADRIAEVCASFHPDPATLAAGTAQSGMAVPPFVAALRAAVGGDAAGYVHYGATSQDILDTALAVQLRTVLDSFDDQLAEQIALLRALADRHRQTVMVARTRTQQAAPTVFGLKCAGWLMPLVAQRRRLSALRPDVLTVQLGGAAGTMAALGANALAVTAALARKLQLGDAVTPWHTQRDRLGTLAGWLSVTSGALGKLGQDCMLLAQSEVAEIRLANAGGSSTLPHKQNPVAAEILVTLARFNAGQIGTFHQALVQEHERGGPGWSLEWLVLPQMLAAVGTGLTKANAMLDGLTVEVARMGRNLQATRGLMSAEAIAFALADHMPLPDAQALVKQACQAIADGDEHLIDRLQATSDLPMDWARLRDPAALVGAADRLIDRALTESEDTDSKDMVSSGC